ILGRRLPRRAAAEIFEIVVDIALIGVERIARGAALGSHHVEIGFQPASPLAAHRGCSLPGGMVSLISRGCGSTNVTSATIPPRMIPPRIARIARNLKSVGKSRPPLRASHPLNRA